MGTFIYLNQLIIVLPRYMKVPTRTIIVQWLRTTLSQTIQISYVTQECMNNTLDIIIATLQWHTDKNNIWTRVKLCNKVMEILIQLWEIKYKSHANYRPFSPWWFQRAYAWPLRPHPHCQSQVQWFFQSHALSNHQIWWLIFCRLERSSCFPSAPHLAPGYLSTSL